MDRDSARLAISAAQESPGDRVPVFGAFDSSDPVAGAHVFHRNLYFPSRDHWRRLGRLDCCCRIRVLQPLPRIFRQTAKAAGHLKARKGRLSWRPRPVTNFSPPPARLV